MQGFSRNVPDVQRPHEFTALLCPVTQFCPDGVGILYSYLSWDEDYWGAEPFALLKQGEVPKENDKPPMQEPQSKHLLALTQERGTIFKHFLDATKTGSTVVNYQSDEDSEYDEDTENVSRKMPIVTQSVLHQPNDQLNFSGRNLKEGGQSFQARLYGQLPDIRSMITAEDAEYTQTLFESFSYEQTVTKDGRNKTTYHLRDLRNCTLRETMKAEHDKWRSLPTRCQVTAGAMPIVTLQHRTGPPPIVHPGSGVANWHKKDDYTEMRNDIRRGRHNILNCLCGTSYSRYKP